jgi:hypothetical protein
MRLRKHLNELILKKDKRRELRDLIINAITPGAIRLNKALKSHKGHDKLTLDVRDAKILMNGIEKVLKFLDKIEIEK